MLPPPLLACRRLEEGFDCGCGCGCDRDNDCDCDCDCGEGSDFLGAVFRAAAGSEFVVAAAVATGAEEAGAIPPALRARRFALRLAELGMTSLA